MMTIAMYSGLVSWWCLCLLQYFDIHIIWFWIWYLSISQISAFHPFFVYGNAVPIFLTKGLFWRLQFVVVLTLLLRFTLFSFLVLYLKFLIYKELKDCKIIICLRFLVDFIVVLNSHSFLFQSSVLPLVRFCMILDFFLRLYFTILSVTFPSIAGSWWFFCCKYKSSANGEYSNSW